MAEKPEVPSPKRPTNLPHGRWLGDLTPLSYAEQELVKACTAGRIWKPKGWDGKHRPVIRTERNEIRGELLRFLALGGDSEHPVHEEGVMAWGAWVSGALNLHQANVPARLSLKRCHFESTPSFAKAQLPELVLSGSAMPGLEADGARVFGDIVLRDRFKATGEVRLLGAKIKGDLVCSRGIFCSSSGHALSADRIRVSGSIFLSHRFVAIGKVRLVGAEIGSNLICSGGCFNNPGSDALIADRITVKGSLFLRSAKVKGAILLVAARLGSLVDDETCWNAGQHKLDGLQYDRITGSIDAISRIRWLKLQREKHLKAEFRPQPWEQLIKVLREMGHPYEAGEIAIAKQQQMREARKIKGWARTIPHWIYGKMAGYGHRPMWTVRWMVAVWLIMGIVFWAGADHYGVIAPANPMITSETLYPEAVTLCGHGNELTTESGKTRWTECTGVPDEYSTFQPFIYSLDLILPLVDLQQEADWAPVAEGPTGKDLPVGVVLRWLMWFEILFGWMASLMLVAVLGRLVDKD